jgi:hypothetical protein
VKRVVSGLRSTSLGGFLFGLKLLFQPGRAAKLNAVYHFAFTGKEENKATVTIREAPCRSRMAITARPTCV